MAARRRRSSASSKASSGVPKSPGEAPRRAARNPHAREGKTTTQCPACGTEYRIPVEMLGDQIKCKSCSRVFVPTSASKRRIRSQNSATPFIMGGAVLAFMVIAYFLITMGGGSRTTGTDPNRNVRRVETGDKNPRVRDVQDWLSAVSEGNAFKLGTNSDFGELAKFLEIGLTDGTADDRQRIVVEALLHGEKTAFLRDTYVTSAQVPEEEAEASVGKVRVYLGIKAEFEKKYTQQSAQFDVGFRYFEGRGRVTDFEALYQPPLRRPDKPRGPRASTHDIIGSAQNVDRQYGGETVIVREADLKALPHLEGTSAEIQGDIEENITRLIDIDAGGLVTNRASSRLKRIGKPSVPRLLNKLYELVMGQQTALEDLDTVLRIRKVTQALEDLTGQRFGFNPSAVGSTPTANHEYRLSSLKQWYGWWADNHWRKDFDYAIDKEINLFGENESSGEDPPEKRR